MKKLQVLLLANVVNISESRVGFLFPKAPLLYTLNYKLLPFAFELLPLNFCL
jgi:hypothetical protein